MSLFAVSTPMLLLNQLVQVDIKKAERDDLDAAARGLAPRLRQDQKQHTLLRNDMLQLRNDIVTLQEQHDAIAQKLADDRAEVCATCVSKVPSKYFRQSLS